jgi:hypothetical protein
MFSLQQNWRTRGQNRFCLESRWGGGKEAQTMNTHMNKCENNKRSTGQVRKRDLYGKMGTNCGLSGFATQNSYWSENIAHMHLGRVYQKM